MTTHVLFYVIRVPTQMPCGVYHLKEPPVLYQEFYFDLLHAFSLDELNT
jgi:hypothetical protein